MPGRYFISYSVADASDLAMHLHDSFESTTDALAWIDKLNLASGRDWDSGIADGIRDSEVVLFVMTADSIKESSNCKKELMLALSYKKPIVPLRFQPVNLPFLINTRQWIPFDNFERGMARLREYIRWRTTPAAALQDLRDRLADAERDLTRADDTNRARIEQDIAQLKKQIAEQEKIVADPAAAAKRTEQSIERAIERERAPEKPISRLASRRIISKTATKKTKSSPNSCATNRAE